MTKINDNIVEMIKNKSDIFKFDSYRKDQERYKEEHKKRTQKIIENDVLTAFGNHLIKKYNIISTNGDMYIYINNFYNIGIDIIKKEYADYAGTYSGKKNLLDYIIDTKNIDIEEFKSPDNLLNLNNGVLNMDTKELYKHDPKYLFRYKLSWNYDESVDITQMLNFLYESLSTTEQVNTLLEYLSTCLMSGYEYQNILFCVGDTNTGKSKIQELMIKFLGGEKRNSAISIEQLAKDSFMENLLKNKLANIADESEEVCLKKVSRLKALSGGSFITNRGLYEKGETHKNEAILIFFCNSLPVLKTWENRNLVAYHDDAFYSRCVILSFEHTFIRKEDMDTRILEKIFTPANMSALLALTIEARNRLIKVGDFTMDRAETKDKWIRYQTYGSKNNNATSEGKNNNAVRKFTEECLVTNPNNKELAKSVYTHYKCWIKSSTYCRNNALIPLSQQAFNKVLINFIKTEKERGHANKEYFTNLELIND